MPLSRPLQQIPLKMKILTSSKHFNFSQYQLTSPQKWSLQFKPEQTTNCPILKDEPKTMRSDSCTLNILSLILLRNLSNTTCGIMGAMKYGIGVLKRRVILTHLDPHHYPLDSMYSHQKWLRTTRGVKSVGHSKGCWLM